MVCGKCGERFTSVREQCPSCKGDPLVDGRYRLEDILECDAAGTSYLGRRLSDDRQVRVRKLPFRRLDGLDRRAAFDQLGARLRSLDHAALPSCIDAFTVTDARSCTLWLVYEHFAGQTLADEREAGVRLAASDVLALLEQLAAVLTHMHEQRPPFVHGAITASKVLRREDGGLALLDLGPVDAPSQPVAVGSRAIAASLAAMAPEQFFAPAEAPTDVWALGLLAVVLLSGAQPLQLRDARHRLHWRRQVEVPAQLAKLLDRMLDDDPQQRPQARELSRALARLRDAPRRRLRVVSDPLPAKEAVAESAEAVTQRTPERAPAPPRRPPTAPPRPRLRKRAPLAVTRHVPGRASMRTPSRALEDVPVRRPEELSSELSQAHRATVELERRQRTRAVAALLIIAATAAVIAAIITLVVLLG